MSILLPACGPIARILVTQWNLFLSFVVAWRLGAMPADDRLIETTILVDVFRFLAYESSDHTEEIKPRRHDHHPHGRLRLWQNHDRPPARSGSRMAVL